MHIAVNARFLLAKGLEGIGTYTWEIISRLVETQPQVKWTLLFDRKPPEEYRFKAYHNVKVVVLFPPARHPLLWYVYFQNATKAWLQRIKPDVYFSPDGYLALPPPVPSVPVIHDIAFEHYPDTVKPEVGMYYRRYMPRFAHAATTLLTVSAFSANDIAQTYSVEREKIVVAANGVKASIVYLKQPTRPEWLKDMIGDKPYFSYLGSLNPRKNIPGLLHSFDIFKQRGGTDHQLVLVGNRSGDQADTDAVLASLSSRDSIHFAGFRKDEDEVNQFLSGCTAFLYLSFYEGFGLPILEAMRAGAPVICADSSAIAEVAGDAALLADPNDMEAIAHHMKSLVENGELVRQLRAKGLDRQAQFSWEVTATQVWDVLQKAANAPR